MKKILALLLTVLMLVLMVSCDSGVIDVTPSKEITRGTVSGNIYKNEFLGFEFHAPNSWKYYTDAEIAAAMNIAVDNFFEDDFKKLLENNPSVYDMMVVDSLTGTNVGVCYENLSMSGSTNITEEQYIEIVKNQHSGLSSMTVTFSDNVQKVKLGGADFSRCICTNTTYGVELTQVYYLKKVD